MYISITVLILIAIVVFLWFRKPLDTVGKTGANVIVQGCETLNVAAEYLTNVVSYNAQKSLISMQEDQGEILHRMASLPQGVLTPSQLWRATNMAQSSLFVDAKGNPLPQYQQNQMLMTQFQTLLNNARQQSMPIPQAQPAQQPAQKPIPRGKGTVRKVNLPA